MGGELLQQLFDGEYDGGVVEVVEVAHDAAELAFGVIAQGGSDDDLMSTDGDLHDESPL